MSSLHVSLLSCCGRSVYLTTATSAVSATSRSFGGVNEIWSRSLREMSWWSWLMEHIIVCFHDCAAKSPSRLVFGNPGEQSALLPLLLLHHSRWITNPHPPRLRFINTRGLLELRQTSSTALIKTTAANLEWWKHKVLTARLTASLPPEKMTWQKLIC